MKAAGPAVTVALMLAVASAAGAATGRYRLTWREDPSTTMVVGWSQTGGGDPVVCYGPEDFGNDWERYPLQKFADRSTTYGGMDNRFARLTELLPDTPYYFVIEDGGEVGERYWFRTAPDQPKPFTFIAGGDSRSNRGPRQLANRMVAKLRPLFVAFGADFTESGSSIQWQEWLDDWQLTTTGDGRLIPIFVCRGTHETTNSVVDGLFDPASADLYYALGIGGSLFRLYTLNSEITEGGAQQTWLEGDLQDHGGTRFKVAQYHKSLRSHNLGKSEGDDEYAAWAQAFFDHGLAVAFESHSHCAKITWPLRPDRGPGSDEGFVRDDSAGTVFVGEGGWGAPLRPAGDNKEWTLDSGSFNHFTWVQVFTEHMEVRTVLTDGEPGAGSVAEGDPFAAPAGLMLWPHVGGPVVRVPRLASEASDEVLLPARSVWSYQDSADAPPSDWASGSFDDATWHSGPARLGYGGDGEATLLSFGSDPLHKPITCYFRCRFAVERPDELTALSLRLVRDDGAAVYLNGTEVARSNLGAGVLVATTAAELSVGDDEESAYQILPLPNWLLRAGDNVLAVEVHQVDGGSSDLGLDAILVANRSPGLAAWTQYHFGEEAGASELAGLGQDPDGDGLSNLVEYASLLDPLVADGNQQAAAVVGGGIEFVYREARQHPGVGFVVEWSTDLVSWYGSGEGPRPKLFVATPIEDDPADGWVRQRVVIPAGDEARIFLRLRATML